MTEDCFLIATTGMTSTKKQLFDKKTEEADALIQEGKFDDAAIILKEIKATQFTSIKEEDWKDNPTAEKLRKTISGPVLKNQLALLDLSPKARERINNLRNMIALIEKGEPVDNKVLVKFIFTTPSKYWHNRKDTSGLMKACDAACREYIGFLKEKKKFTHQLKAKYIDLWVGMPLRNELYSEYNDNAKKELEKINNAPSRSKGYKKNQLTSFIRKWKTGEAVDQAKVQLENL